MTLVVPLSLYHFITVSVGDSSLVDDGEPIDKIGCFGGWSSAEDAVGIGIQNGILR